ncbi:hypothetical protein ABPG72_010583 [Tetrahymena utriculariae]
MYHPINEPVQKKSCLQVYISWTSYINLVLSFAALAFGIYLGVKNKNVWSNSSFDWNKMLIALLITGSVFLLLASIAGICGGRKQNRCCIFIFQMLSIILALFFLIIGFIFLGVTDSHFTDIQDSNCQNGSNGTQIFQYGQEAYDSASKLFCTKECPCKVTDSNVKSYITKNYILLVPFMSDNGAVKVQDCADYENEFTDSNVKDQANWLRSLEESFECTGMCTKQSNIYYFSDINNGIPDSETCKEKFQDFIKSYGRIAYIVGLIVGSYLLINAILAFCLCCRKKNSGQSLYERFANY